MPLSTHTIFPSWDFPYWTDVDDRVRGGSSTSHLEPILIESDLSGSEKGKTAAKFWGHLGQFDFLAILYQLTIRYRYARRSWVRFSAISIWPPTASTPSNRIQRNRPLGLTTHIHLGILQHRRVHISSRTYFHSRAQDYAPHSTAIQA
jgi:hypothetical protein